MCKRVTLVLGTLGALAWAEAGFAQTDFLAARKIACTPDRITRCSAENQCESREASARDKSEILVIDFVAKKSFVRKGGKEEAFGDVVDDKVAGEQRSFAMREPGSTDNSKAIQMVVSRAGKLTLKLDGERHRAEATCAVES